jgi:Type II secretion system (T2SS), protein E, N-terminal domain
VSVNLHPVTDDVAEPVLPEAAVGPAPVDRIPLGRLFVNAGLLTEAQVDDALREGSQTGERLGEVIVRRGLVTEERVAQMLAEQWQLSYVDRASIWFDADALARLSREDAQRLQAMPTRVQDGRVVVAVAEPTEQRLNSLREVIGTDTVVVVVPKTALDAALNSELLTSRRVVGGGGHEPVIEAAAPPASVTELRTADAVGELAPPAYRDSFLPPEPDMTVPISSDLDSVAALAQQARTVAESLAAQAAAMRAEAAAHQRQIAEAHELDQLRARVAELEAELASERAALVDIRRYLQDALRALPLSD